MQVKKIFLVVLSLINFYQASAHPDLIKRILEVSAEIKKHPDSAYLYVKRGKLYYQHEEYKKSFKDVKKSEDLGYSSIEQQLLYAGVAIHIKRYKTSNRYLKRVLIESPGNVSAFKLLGDLNFKRKKYSQSSKYYIEVIKHSKVRIPENYIDASISYQLISSSESFQKAEEIIKKGINDLGHLVVLHEKLIELFIQQKKYQDAIVVQESIIDRSNRKEQGYFKLYKLYKMTGNNEQALVSLENSKNAINSLPQRIQNSLFIKNLKKDLNKEYKATINTHKKL